MAYTPRFFGRKYRLTLDAPGGGSLVFEVEEGKPAMDIKFDVSYARGVTAREGTISILGLSRDTMYKYTNLAGMTRGKAMSQLVHVSLEAGYLSAAGMVKVLDGFVWYATVSSPPTMWLTLRVSEYNPLGGRAAEIDDIGPCTMRTAVEEVMAKFTVVEGVSFKVQDMTEDGIFDASNTSITLPFGGNSYTIGNAVNFLNQNVSDDVQFILMTGDNDKNVRTLLAVDKNAYKATRGEVNINGNTGLLSVTGIDAVNGCITAFIDGQWSDSMSHLNLVSALNPQANGRYYIVRRQFVGHYMGREWYARYFCSAREGDDVQEKENLRISAYE